MIHTIQNQKLTVQIDEKGAQLWSIRSADGTEYLWQGDSRYWSDRALNLFPQIGLCTNDTYTVGGKTYSMDIHGFIKDTIGETVAAISAIAREGMQVTDEVILDVMVNR